MFRVHSLYLYIPLALSHFGAFAVEGMDVNAFRSINTAVSRMESWEAQERMLLESNRWKVEKLARLARLADRAPAYSPLKAGYALEVDQLEASINNLRPTLEQLQQNIERAQDFLRRDIVQFRTRIDAGGVGKADLEALSPSARQLVDRSSAISKDTGWEQGYSKLFDTSRAARLGGRAKYPDQIDKSERQFTSRETKRGAVRAKLSHGDIYSITDRHGDTIHGKFIGFENDKLVFQDASLYSSKLGERALITMRPKDIVSLGEAKAVARNTIDPSFPSLSRNGVFTDAQVKEAILGEGIASLIRPRGTPKQGLGGLHSSPKNSAPLRLYDQSPSKDPSTTY